jgi:hypothetical protein
VNDRQVAAIIWLWGTDIESGSSQLLGSNTHDIAWTVAIRLIRYQSSLFSSTVLSAWEKTAL